MFQYDKVTLARGCYKDINIYSLEYLQQRRGDRHPKVQRCCLFVFTTYSTATERRHLLVLFFFFAFHMLWSHSLDWSASERGWFPEAWNGHHCLLAQPQKPRVHRAIGPPVKWNTPSCFHGRRSGSPSGCWRGNLGCPPAWLPSPLGWGRFLFAGRGIWLLLPGQSQSQRWPLQWYLRGGEMSKCHRAKYVSH